MEAHKRDSVLYLEGFLLKYPETVVGGIHHITARDGGGGDEKRIKIITRGLGQCQSSCLAKNLDPARPWGYMSYLFPIFPFIPTAKY